MRENRFLIIVAHPKHGRIGRFGVSYHTLLAGASLVALAGLVLVGLAADWFEQAKENERLLAQSEALREEYESLAQTSQERDKQLASLSGLAYQVSVAYGIQRDELGSAEAFGSEPLPAYYASLDQYDRLQDAISGSFLLANGTPSIWPVKGRITSAYGRRQDPFHGRGAFHAGMDIAAPYGSPVRATADGFVTDVGRDARLGIYVKISHGKSGFSTVYGHLKEYLVREGQPVRRAELIGLVGSTGRSTGMHVHYEVRLKGLRVNPYRYLKSAPTTYGISRAD